MRLQMHLHGVRAVTKCRIRKPRSKDEGYIADRLNIRCDSDKRRRERHGHRQTRKGKSDARPRDDRICTDKIARNSERR